MNNCANQYLELFPCIDSLWFGEGFNYDEPPDYWMVEAAGIPYGLFGEMMGSGNPWRGMVYGMTNRLGWGGNPRSLWKLWDEFGHRRRPHDRLLGREMSGEERSRGRIGNGLPARGSRAGGAGQLEPAGSGLPTANRLQGPGARSRSHRAGRARRN